MTQKAFGETLGISEPEVSIILKAFETRIKYDLNEFKLSTQNVYAIHRLDDSYKDQLIAQLKVGKTPTIMPLQVLIKLILVSSKSGVNHNALAGVDQMGKLPKQLYLKKRPCTYRLNEDKLSLSSYLGVVLIFSEDL